MTHSLFRSTALALLVAAAGSAQAAAMLVPIGGTGDFTVTDPTSAGGGTYTMNLNPSSFPNPVAYWDTNPPGGQSATNVASLIGAAYSVDPNTLTSVASCDAVASCGNTSVSGSLFSALGINPFTYFAIHLGGGELFFHWSAPITGLTLTALNPTTFPSGISNWRAYSDVAVNPSTVPVPGALALFLSGLGFLGLGRKVARQEPAADASFA